MSLEVNDNVVLTELAYEKARRIGMKLVLNRPDNPPSAPVRPYIAQKQCRCAAPAIVVAPVPRVQENAPPPPAKDVNVQQRVRDAVVARLGTQIDPNLLDVIIKRVLTSTGVK